MTRQSKFSDWVVGSARVEHRKDGRRGTVIGITDKAVLVQWDEGPSTWTAKRLLKHIRGKHANPR